MKKINTVLFDLDGTLVDSNELIIETFRQTITQFYPDKVLSRSQLIDLVGPPLRETFEQYTHDSFLIQEMISTYRSIYKKLEFDYITLYPNVIKTLSDLKHKGYNLGIVTTKFLESAYPSIKYFNIDQYFDVIIGLDDVQKHKPDPEPIHKALEKLQYQEVVMVGDNSSDIMAGVNAGTLTCGVTWSMKFEQIKDLNPTFWISDYNELVNKIESYNKEAL